MFVWRNSMVADAPARCRTCASISVRVVRPYFSGSRVPSRFRFGPLRNRIRMATQAIHRSERCLLGSGGPELCFGFRVPRLGSFGKFVSRGDAEDAETETLNFEPGTLEPRAERMGSFGKFRVNHE